MKTLSARLCLLLSFACAAHVCKAGAAAPTPDMRAALERMVAAQDLELGPALLDRGHDEGLEIVQRTGADLIAAHTTWNAAQQAHARDILEQMAPQVVETVRAERRKLLAGIGPDMIREVYPRYFSAAEIGELAAYYASTAYKKMRPLMSRAETEARRTGGDKLALWRELAAAELTEEDVRILREFRASELGRKLDRTIAQLYRDWGVYWDSRARQAIDAAMIAYRQEFAQRMAGAASR